MNKRRLPNSFSRTQSKRPNNTGYAGGYGFEPSGPFINHNQPNWSYDRPYDGNNYPRDSWWNFNNLPYSNNRPNRNNFRKPRHPRRRGAVKDSSKQFNAATNSPHETGSDGVAPSNDGSQKLPAVTSTQDCRECTVDTYLICKGSHESVELLLLNNPPEFFNKLKAYRESYRTSGSLRMVCKNCKTGAMSTPEKLVEHLRSKVHLKTLKCDELKNDESIPLFAKVTVCPMCGMVYFINSKTEDESHQELPEDMQDDIIKTIYPLARLNIHSTADLNLPKRKEKKTLHIIVSKLDKSLPFDILFEELTKFGREYNQNIQYVCCAETPDEKIGFCYYFRSQFIKTRHPDLVEMVINECVVPAKIVNTLQFDAAITDVKTHNYPCSVWINGYLTPTCEMFSIWSKVEPFLDNKVAEMEKASIEFEKLKDLLTNDLMVAIGKKWKIQSIDFFGSRVTGLALCNSDFDLQISIEPKCTVKDISLTVRPQFTVGTVIPWAKVPIIRLQHKATSLKCDVSLNNFCGVTNSKLLKFYLEMDERAKWLVVAIKQWVAMNLMSGSFAFTSYGLAWLVLFILMQQGVELVPPVSVLTTLTCTSDQHVLHCQETGSHFFLDMEELMKVHNPKTKCNLNKKELLKHVFESCLTIMSSKDALDPFSGQTKTRKDLSNSFKNTTLKGNMTRNKNLMSYSLVIIDPINRSTNISASVKSKNLNNFKLMAEQILEGLSGNASG